MARDKLYVVEIVHQDPELMFDFRIATRTIERANMYKNELDRIYDDVYMQRCESCVNKQCLTVVKRITTAELGLREPASFYLDTLYNEGIVNMTINPEIDAKYAYLVDTNNKERIHVE